MAEENNQNQTQNEQPAANTQQGGAPAIDYEKLASILAGRTAATEESVLKGYFKQQGITGEEAQQAIAAFKQQRAEKSPDAAALKQQAEKAAIRATMENKALLTAAELGVELKTMPYVLKMADLSGAVADGAIDDEKLKAAISQVLEDIPQLKAATKAQEQANTGFRVGANAGGTGEVAYSDKLRDAFGLPKK